MTKRTRQIGAINAMGSDGKRYRAIVRVEEEGTTTLDGQTHWTQGVPEVLLSTGEHVNPGPEGTFIVMSTGVRLTPLKPGK